MTGFWLALSVIKSVAEIRAVLEQRFPMLAIEYWDLSSLDRAKEALETPSINSADVLFQVDYNRSEFPTGVHLDKFPDPQEEALEQPTIIALARIFSTAFDCRTITDGSCYGEDDSPCWAIIWDRSRPFLADLCDTEFMDQTGRPVKVVREISLPSLELDGSGHLVG